MVYYHGLYVSGKKDNQEIGAYFSYIRFYKDGLVMQVSSTGSPSDVIKWFHRDNPDMPKGFFAAAGEEIHFAVTSEAGVVVYHGVTVGNHQLKLTYYSHINGNEDSETYRFTAL